MDLVDFSMANNKWIQNIKMKKGAFTKQAAKVGKTPAQFQQTVLANNSRYSPTTVKRARLRKTLVSNKVRRTA